MAGGSPVCLEFWWRYGPRAAQGFFQFSVATSPWPAAEQISLLCLALQFKQLSCDIGSATCHQWKTFIQKSQHHFTSAHKAYLLCCRPCSPWKLKKSLCSSRPVAPLKVKTTSKLGIIPTIDIILVFSTALCTVQCRVFRQEKRPKIGHFHAKIPAPAYARST